MAFVHGFRVFLGAFQGTIDMLKKKISCTWLVWKKIRAPTRIVVQSGSWSTHRQKTLYCVSEAILDASNSVGIDGTVPRAACTSPNATRVRQAFPDQIGLSSHSITNS